MESFLEESIRKQVEKISKAICSSNTFEYLSLLLSFLACARLMSCTYFGLKLAPLYAEEPKILVFVPACLILPAGTDASEGDGLSCRRGGSGGNVCIIHLKKLLSSRREACDWSSSLLFFLMTATSFFLRWVGIFNLLIPRNGGLFANLMSEYRNDGS